MQSDRLAGDMLAAGMPTWVADLALPIGFALIALRLVWHASPRWQGRAVAALGIVAGILLNYNRAMLEGQSLLPGSCSCILAGVVGAPIFALLGGFALFASLDARQSAGRAADDGVPGADDVDRRLPRFRCSRSRGFCWPRATRRSGCCASSARWFGWVPGGTAVAAATLCAFFTLFTGGSGVTILVLGGLLLPALTGNGYRERFSIGLLTASGSLGLLFPLSLPLMLYGIVSQKASDRRPVHRRPAAGDADARRCSPRSASAKAS